MDVFKLGPREKYDAVLISPFRKRNQEVWNEASQLLDVPLKYFDDSKFFSRDNQEVDFYQLYFYHSMYKLARVEGKTPTECLERYKEYTKTLSVHYFILV